MADLWKIIKYIKIPQMPKKGEKRDPLLDCPNVKAYREIVHLQLNYLQRQYVVEKVSCCERGQRLWRASLVEWMLYGYSPKNVVGMVKLWENQFWATEGVKFEAFQVNGNGRG